MKYLPFLLPYLETGLIFTIGAVLVERLLIVKGMVRGNTFFLASFVFVFSVLFQLVKFPKPIALDIFETFVLLILAPLKSNQSDFIATIDKGRWWWKQMG